MKISQDMAKSIIKSLSTVLEYNLNFFDTNGIIIYSTDASRIGTFHGAALDCVKRQCNIFVNTNKEYEGAKKGINIPIIIYDKVVGVIGITGDKNLVLKYENLVSKTTEILVKDLLKKKERYKFFVSSLLHNMDDYEDFYQLDNTSLKYTVVAKNQFSKTQIDKLYTKLGKLLQDKHVYTVFRNELIIIFKDVDIENIKRVLSRIDNKLYFGISNPYYDILDFKTSYDNALVSLDWIKNTDLTENMVEYEKQDLAILLSTLNKETIRKYKQKVLKKLSDYEDYRHLILSYASNNGSITKIAQDLYMHKNTIQYRINKLKSITNLDPRNTLDFTKLYLAFILN